MKIREHWLLHASLLVGVGCGVVVFAASLAQSVVNAAGPTVRFYTSPSQVSVERGQQFTARVRLEKTSTEKVNYVDARLRFDASRLEITGVSKVGSVFNQSSGPSISYINSAGSVTIQGKSDGFVPISTGLQVASLTFRAKVSGTTQIRFSSQSQAGQLAGNNIKNVLDSTSAMTVAVTSPPPTAATSPSTPTSPSSTTPTASPPSASSSPEPSADESTIKEQKSPTQNTSDGVAYTAPDESVTSEVPRLFADGDDASIAAQPANVYNFRLTLMNFLLALLGVVTIAGGLFVYGYKYFGWFGGQGKVRHVLALGGTAMYAADYIPPERLVTPIWLGGGNVVSSESELDVDKGWNEDPLPPSAAMVAAQASVADEPAGQKPLEAPSEAPLAELEQPKLSKQKLMPYLKTRRLQIPKRRR